MITHLVTPEALAGDAVDVEGDAYRHYLRARRAVAGERWRLVDGEGRARWGTLEEVDRRRARVVLGEPAPSNEPPFDLVLLVAPLRPERAAWLIEKATELGVAAIRFVSTERTPRDVGPAALARWRRLARAAVEQCHRARLPLVDGVHPWSDLGRLLGPLRRRIVLEPGASGTAPRGDGDLGLVVGPEGGLAERERDALRALGAAPLGLGPRVLRAETAAVAGAALFLAV